MNRLITLAGGRNFRDLGGYATSDGRRVRWQKLYRSGVMSEFTDEDCVRLDTLGIRVICDLRTPRERQREATRWTDTRTQRLHWDYDNDRVSLRRLMGGDTPSPASTKATMIRLYQVFPEEFAVPYAALFTRLAGGDVPLLFNCSAGKDRTGVAAALVLTALGVPWDQVLADYCLTNELVDLERIITSSHGSLGFGDDTHRFARLDPETRAPLLRAAPEYLEAAFAAIRSKYGSVDGYFDERLGIGAVQLAAIRGQLLESSPDNACISAEQN